MNNWSVQKAFEKVTKDRSVCRPASPAIHVYSEHDYIPLEAWEEALVKAAHIVEKWGMDYLPIFERTQYELEKTRQQLESLEKARNIAKGKRDISNNVFWQQSDFFEP